jgi:hypothetical protein
MFTGVFIPDALVRYQQLNPTAKILWARLARYAGNDGRVYPAVRTLPAELGLSDRQVQRCLAALERQGLIRREFRKTERGDYTSTEFVFLFHKIFVQAAANLHVAR